MVMRKPARSVSDTRYYRADVKDPSPGFYRARVELTRDPKKQGRVKIRIPHMHGILPDEGGDEERCFRTSELPWAMPGDFSCAGYDYGQHMVPHVGTFVWVGFEAGDPDQPIYFGGIPYREGGEDKKYGHIDNVPDRINEDHPDFMNHATEPYYVGSDGSYIREVYELDGQERETTEDVSRQVLFKSVKGHAIVADDTDEKESFTIMDRLGQMIKFISPVTYDGNEGNEERRGIRTSYNEDTLHSDDDEIEDHKAILMMKDIDNQIIRMVAEEEKDKIEVMSRDPELERNCGAVFSSELDKVNFSIVAEDDDDRVILFGKNEDNISHLLIVKGGTIETHLKLTADEDEGMLVETVKAIKLVSNENVEVETQQQFKVNAKGGIRMETEGAINFVANQGIYHNTPTTNIYMNSHKVAVDPPYQTACWENLEGLRRTGSSSIAVPPYVPPGLSQVWEDAHDEDYIKEG